MTSGWNTSAAIPAIKAAMNNVSIAGTFFTISSPVSTGTTRSQGVILNASFKEEEKSDILDASV